jgi:hypothetical protein
VEIFKIFYMIIFFLALNQLELLLFIQLFICSNLNYLDYFMIIKNILMRILDFPAVFNIYLFPIYHLLFYSHQISFLNLIKFQNYLHFYMALSFFTGLNILLIFYWFLLLIIFCIILLFFDRLIFTIAILLNTYQ